MNIADKLCHILGIRSPSLDYQGYYDCENCRHHDDCICVVCEDGKTVVCMLQHKHVYRHSTCKDFRPQN